MMNAYPDDWTSTNVFNFPNDDVQSNETMVPFEEPNPDESSQPAKYMIVRVDDPQKRSSGIQGSYMTYRVTTKTTIETFSYTEPRPVRRRFRDFVWLHEALTLEFPECIVPPLPEKYRLGYLNGDRFNADFIEQRLWSLQWFMDRVARHPILQASQSTRIFLESNDFKTDSQIQSPYTPLTTSWLDTLSMSLMNAFVTVKKPDQQFLDIKEVVEKLSDNLATIEKLYSRIARRQYDLQRDYTSFAWSIREISTLESQIELPLRQFAEATEAYSKAFSDMSKREKLLFMNGLHELLAYCGAVKETLERRDESQIDFEELSAYLQKAIEEQEKHSHRGVDPSKAEADQLKIKELQEEVARTNDVTNRFSDQVIQEFKTFQEGKTTELKQGLMAYADSHIEFYTKSISIWESVIPALESIQLDTDSDGRDDRDEHNATYTNDANDVHDAHDTHDASDTNDANTFDGSVYDHDSYFGWPS